MEKEAKPQIKKYFPCYKCQTRNRMGDETCRNCGAPFQYNCPGCGAIIKPGEPKCAQCGVDLHWPFHEGAEAGQPEGTRKRKSLIGPFLGIIVIIAVLAGGAYYILRFNQAPAPPAPTGGTQAPSAPQISVTDKTPPVISHIVADNISFDSEEIKWTTDEPATSQVLWNAKGDYPTATPEQEALVTDHVVDLINLKPKIVYYFKVKSADQARNEAVSEQKVFGIAVDLGKTQVVVTHSSMSVAQQSPSSTKTFIAGEMQNTGDLSVMVKDLQVPVLTTIAGRPQAEILAVIDSNGKTQMDPADTFKFSVQVPNETDPSYLVSVRINEQ